MLSISHAVTGAVIATNIGNPYISIPIILLSHYLEDAVPHWDAGTGLGSGKKTRQQAIIHGIIDLVLAGIIVLIFYPPDFSLITAPLSLITPAIWGAFLGLLPDFLEAPRNFLKWEPAFMKPINKFHHSFHHSIPRMWDGLAPQILLLIILWFIK
jgi:hypothetical protein